MLTFDLHRIIASVQRRREQITWQEQYPSSEIMGGLDGFFLRSTCAKLLKLDEQYNNNKIK